MLQPIKLTKVLRFLQLTFKATGIDIFSKHPAILHTLFMFVFIILWILNGYLDGVQNINDTELGGLSVSIIFLTYGLLSFIKFATVNLMKQRYLHILNWMKNLYQPNKILEITTISKDIMRQCLDRSQFTIRFQFMFYLGAGVLIVMKPMYTLQFKSLPVPYFIYLLPREPIHYFIIHYIFQTLCFIINVTLAFNYVTFFVTTTLHLEAQLSIVIGALEALNNKAITIDYRKSLIKYIAVLHNETYGICEELSKTALFVILFQFLHHIVAQCFCFYTIINGSNYIVVVIVFGATVELLFFCYAGQRLATAGEAVSDAIYLTNWYQMTIQEQKLLMFMLRKSQDSIYISAGGFFRISLETFLFLIKTGFSFFAVLSSFDK